MKHFRAQAPATAIVMLGALTLATSSCGGGGSSNAGNGSNVTDYAPTARLSVTTPSPLMRGATVTLSGATSTDPESQPLSYTWSLLQKPVGSAATISPDGGDPAMAQFLADVDGTYAIRLEVTDAASLSGTADLDVTVDKALWGAATWGTHYFDTAP